MSNKGKIITILSVFLILIALSLTAVTFYLLQKEKAKSNTLQEQIEELTTRQRIAEKKLEDAKIQAQQLEKQLQESRDQLNSLNSELDKAKKLREETLKESEQLKTVLKQKETAERDSRDKLTQSQQKISSLEAQLKSVESEKSELTKKIREAEQTNLQKVELGEIVVGQQAPSSAAPVKPAKKQELKTLSFEGKVLVVNKDYNFAIINLGNRDGVNVGSIFSVYNKNKYIGDIKVEKVHDSMSAAGFVSADLKDKINEGDRAVLKK